MVKNENVILVVYKDDYYIDEAKSLAQAAGYGVSEVITIRKFRGGKFGISEEKANILKSLVLNNNATKVILDGKLSASQNYNLSKYVGCPVLDREKLVLEIFALRAVTEEAKLQVKYQKSENMSKSRSSANNLVCLVTGPTMSKNILEV